MTSYRDDTNDILVAADYVKTITKGAANNTAIAGDSTSYKLRINVFDSVGAFDAISGAVTSNITDSLLTVESYTQALSGRSNQGDTYRIADSFKLSVRAPSSDSLTATDESIGEVTARTLEHPVASDQITGFRRAKVFITDTVSAGDQSMQRAQSRLTDSLGAGDAVIHKLRARSLIAELFGAGDSQELAFDSLGRLIDTILATDQITGRLRAKQVIEDLIEIADSFMRDSAYESQAWTADLHSWATSRYSPYTFTSVTVIDGIAYATAADGVYALEGGAETIPASVVMAPMDLGKGALVHPISAYLEYELGSSGTATMDVTTTQSGAAITYSYSLPQETANELTNGRFVFGKGLRGRHFAFTLRLDSSRGHINDLRLLTAPTKRRV